MVVSITEVKQILKKELEVYKETKNAEIAEDLQIILNQYRSNPKLDLCTYSKKIKIKTNQIDSATKKEELLEDAVSRYQELITTVLYLCAECTNIFKFWEGKNFDEILHDLATFERFLQNKNY